MAETSPMAMCPMAGACKGMMEKPRCGGVDRAANPCMAGGDCAHCDGHCHADDG